MKKTFLRAVVIGCIICVFLLVFSTSNLKASMIDPGIFSYQDKSEVADKFSHILNQIELWVNDGEIVGGEIMVIENRDILIHEAYG